MQVMTRVHQDKFDKLGDGMNNPLDPIANIRVGTTILRDCIDRRGSVDGGLACYVGATGPSDGGRSEEHTSELQSLMRISYAVFCLKKKIKQQCILNIHSDTTQITNPTRPLIPNHIHLQHTPY